MEGKEIYTNLIAKRDYSGSRADEYAQLLMTIFLHIGDSIFSLLESAEAENKKLSIIENTSDSDILVDEYTVNDIILV